MGPRAQQKGEITSSRRCAMSRVAQTHRTRGFIPPPMMDRRNVSAFRSSYFVDGAARFFSSTRRSSIHGVDISGSGGIFFPFFGDCFGLALREERKRDNAGSRFVAGRAWVRPLHGKWGGFGKFWESGSPHETKCKYGREGKFST